MMKFQKGENGSIVECEIINNKGDWEKITIDIVYDKNLDRYVVSLGGKLFQAGQLNQVSRYCNKLNMQCQMFREVGVPQIAKYGWRGGD
jgi:hypothetical protein